jgi:hypothetical protein
LRATKCIAIQRGGHLGHKLVDDGFLLNADGDGEEAFRRPAVLLPVRVATQGFHLEV